MSRTESYRDHPHWRRAQSHFPPRARICDADVEEETWSWQGRAIHLDRQGPTDVEALVVLLHGGGGHGRLLGPLGRMLARRAPVRVVAPDLPGYGLSVVRREDVDHRRWAELVGDLVARERGDLPVILFGLSLGGMLAYHVAATLAQEGRPVDGVIATTLADPRLPAVRAELARYAALGRHGLPALEGLARLAPNLRVPMGWLAPMETIANEPSLAAAILADPRAGGNRVPLRFLASIMTLSPPTEPEDYDACPLLWLQPGDDRWTSPACSQPFFERLACPKERIDLTGCGHLPVEEPGVSELEEAVLGFVEAATATPQGAKSAPRRGT